MPSFTAAIAISSIGAPPSDQSESRPPPGGGARQVLARGRGQAPQVDRLLTGEGLRHQRAVTSPTPSIWVDSAAADRSATSAGGSAANALAADRNALNAERPLVRPLEEKGDPTQVSDRVPRAHPATLSPGRRRSPGQHRWHDGRPRQPGSVRSGQQQRRRHRAGGRGGRRHAAARRGQLEDAADRVAGCFGGLLLGLRAAAMPSRRRRRQPERNQLLSGRRVAAPAFLVQAPPRPRRRPAHPAIRPLPHPRPQRR